MYLLCRKSFVLVWATAPSGVGWNSWAAPLQQTGEGHCGETGKRPLNSSFPFYIRIQIIVALLTFVYTISCSVRFLPSLLVLFLDSRHVVRIEKILGCDLVQSLHLKYLFFFKTCSGQLNNSNNCCSFFFWKKTLKSFVAEKTAASQCFLFIFNKEWIKSICIGWQL